MSKVREYTSEGIAVQYDVVRCIHAAECVNRLSAVFDTNKRPWIQPDNANNDTLAHVIEHCPSGALHYARSDGGAEEAIPDANVIVLTADGPHYLSGDLLLTWPDGSTMRETRLALCRCGVSANKPFCDNEHKKVDFEASADLTTPQADREAATNSDGPLQLILRKNGSVVLQGNFIIQNAQGEVVFRGDKAALCRCGGSANKPFCDSTHKTNGFTAD
jgi:CDGSH-type Zn-finger protein/uncharacterized Fe-S cluster protein YjdI